MGSNPICTIRRKAYNLNYERKLIANVTLKNGLMDLIDLKQPNSCRVKIEGTEYCVTNLYTNSSGKKYVMLQGGYALNVSATDFERVGLILEEHLKKHILHRK